MHLDDYQVESAKTAVFPPQHELAYPVLGLVEEVYELMEVSTQDADAIVDELGDIMWYAAAVARAVELKLQNCYDLGGTMENSRSMAHDMVALSAKIAGRAKKILRGDAGQNHKVQAIKKYLGDLMVRVELIAKDYANATLSEVCQRNITKLQDRMERGVLKGDGDKR